MTLAVFGMALSCSALAAADVLIVADEVPAMEVLAGKLKAAAGVQSTIVQQTAMPADLSKYSALVVYIHRTIGEPAEKAFINYAESGGRLVLLHHSISSGKRANNYWFPFLKISLPAGSLEQGGYKYFDPAVMEIVNLAPREFITTHKVAYDRKVSYRDQGELPGFRLEDTEVYLNHVLTAPRTVLLGLKFTDPKSGQTYMQDRAGWYMKTGQGWVMYFMAGHGAREFEHPAYAQILVNAIASGPKP
ncbi:MAG: ThuA domain-containing protein [Acidobacteriota bacterium]|mgnify:CR=1 FL=1